MKNRTSFPVYAVERDDFRGELDVRPCFDQQINTVRTLDSITGLVTMDTMDGGQIGTLTAPSGASLVQIADGETCIQLAGGEVMDIREALGTAKSNAAHSYGIRYNPTKGAENTPMPRKTTSYLVYRTGSNSANQPMTDESIPIAIVEATSRGKACEITWGDKEPTVHGCPSLKSNVVASAGNMDVWGNQTLHAIPQSLAKASDWNWVLESDAMREGT